MKTSDVFRIYVNDVRFRLGFMMTVRVMIRGNKVEIVVEVDDGQNRGG